VAKEESAKPGSDLDASADRIRETAKWLIVSFAGVGSVLVAGSQLSSLGSLELWSERFWIAVSGVAVALVAVIVAINKVSDVLVADPLSLQTLAEPTDGRVTKIKERLEKDPSLVPGSSVASLRDHYNAAVKAQLETYDAYRASAHNTDAMQAAQLADGYAKTQGAVVQNVLSVARLLNVSDLFKRQKQWLVLLTILGAAGIVTFAAAANPPDESPPEPAAVHTLVREGNRVSIRLSATGRALLQERLGENCDTKSLRVLALDVARAGVDVVTLPRAGCAGVRFTLTPLIGSVRTP
jgi:hypothetical protein